MPTSRAGSASPRYQICLILTDPRPYSMVKPPNNSQLGEAELRTHNHTKYRNDDIQLADIESRHNVSAPRRVIAVLSQRCHEADQLNRSWSVDTYLQ